MELTSNIIRFLVALFLAGSLAACNTVEGAGEDIEQGGEAVSETAEDVEDDID